MTAFDVFYAKAKCCVLTCYNVVVSMHLRNSIQHYFTIYYEIPMLPDLLAAVFFVIKKKMLDS